MATLNLEGIGKVKVDDSFRTLSPEDQERTVLEIVQALQGQQTSTPDRSFGSALAYGADQMLENIGTTARALGSESLGDLGSGAIQAPGNYEPAAERFINPGEDDLTILGYGVEYLPRAVVEQVPQMAGSMGARGAGAALGGAVGLAAGPVGGAIGAGVGAFAGPAILSFAQQFGPIAMERARRNGREEPDWDDWVAAAAGAGGSATLDALSILPIGKAGTSILNAAAREGLTETAQSGIEQTASTLGTDEGFEFSAKQALGEGMIGAGAGGTMQAGADTVRGARQVPGAIRDTYQNVQAGIEYSRNPEQIRSDLRIADLYEARVAAERAFDSGKEVSADETFKSITVDLERELKGLADTLYRAGDITKAQRDEIRQAVTRAKRHNYELGERGEESGYFDTEVDTIRQMDLPDQTKQTLINSMRDLNTAAFNSMKKNRRGPIEAALRKGGTSAGAWVGGMAGGPVGAAIGAQTGPNAAGRIGRIGDQFLGLDQPPILRRAEARRRVLGGRQEDYGNTVRDIQAAFQDARSRQKLVVTQQQAQDPQTPIDQTLRDLGVERQGGWVRSMVDYANQNLVPGQRPITQQDLTNAIEELKELGALTEGQAKELLDNKSGVITDERVYYGLQDYLIFRARQEAPGAGTDLTEGVTTQETPQASPAAPETPSVRPDTPQPGTIYNPLSYAQTMENVRQATNNAMMTAPGPMATMVTEVANARTREAKRQALENAREWYPEYREWIDQYLEPLTKFGPQETSSEPYRPQVIRRDSRGRPLQRQPFKSEAAEKILGAYPKVIDGRLRKSNYPRPPDPISREEAKIYKARAGINKPPLTKTLDIPTDYLKRVADWMDKAPHEPDNPAVQRSYAALVQETMAQYEAIGSDLKVEPYDGQGEPYRNAGEMLDDVRENRHLWFFRTENGYGEGDLDRSHPMLQETPYTDTQGRPLLVNDLFRIVHDYFGHTQNATQFGPKGEYNAFHEHARMFSDEAVPALAAETLAQNAWVNFGPHLRNEKGDIPKKGEPGYIPPSERPFSDQKATIVPIELLRQDPNQGALGEGALSVAGGTGGGNPGGSRVTFPTRQEAQKEAFRLRGETGQLHMVQETDDGFIAVPLKPKEPDFGVRPSDLALPDGLPASRIQERLQGDIRRSGGGLLSAVDPEGRELASRFIVGAGSGDFGGLTNPEIERVGAILADVFSVAGAAKTGGAFGAVDYQGSQDQGGHMALFMRDERTPQNEAQWRSTFNHEVGHVVEIRAGIGLMYADAAEADAVMTDLINASREARPYLWTEDDAELARMAPEGKGAQRVRDYRQSHGQGGELFADTIRLYMEQGKAFKQRYPHAAKFIRDVVNESKIKDVIGFTSFAGLGISSILALGLSGLGGEDEPQEETRPLLYG